MTSYKLLYTKTAVSDIQKLDTIVKKKIRKKIELYGLSPIQYAKRLTHDALGMYRWRIGDYRIVFDVEGNSIIILRIGHRREIYKG